jgi:hypothetical protein
MKPEYEHFIFISVLCCLVISPGVLCSYAAASTTTLEITASVPLGAYEISAVDITANSVTITWMTNGLANSTVEYGPTTDYGSSKTDDEMMMNHTISLDGLSPDIEYHYRVVSSDSAGTTVTSNDFIFTTPGSKGIIGSTGGGGSGFSFDSKVGLQVLGLQESSPELTVVSGGLIPLTTDNLVAQPVVVVSGDKSASLSIDTLTRILDKDGRPVNSISLTRIPEQEVFAGPEGSFLVFTGYAYQIEPSGAAFSPPITLKITLPHDEWSRIPGQALSIRYYNPASGIWEPLPTTTDPATYTVFTTISHTSDYGLFALPAPDATPAITTNVAIETTQTSPAPGSLNRPGSTIVVQVVGILAAITVIGVIGLLVYEKRKP